MEYRTIGYIANTHGLKGECRIKPQTHFVEERFAKSACVYLEWNKRMLPLHVVSCREQKGMLVVKFKEVNDINEVEVWKGCRLCVSEEQLQTLDEDEIYYHDLMHMQVVTDAQEPLGEVVEILETGAHVVIRVKGEKECLIPYTKPFIVDVNLKEHILTVSLIEGMV